MINPKIAQSAGLPLVSGCSECRLGRMEGSGARSALLHGYFSNEERSLIYSDAPGVCVSGRRRVGRKLVLRRATRDSKQSGPRGCSSMVEPQLPKLKTRVRFPSPAPKIPYIRIFIPIIQCITAYWVALLRTGSTIFAHHFAPLFVHHFDCMLERLTHSHAHDLDSARCDILPETAGPDPVSIGLVILTPMRRSLPQPSRRRRSAWAGGAAGGRVRPRQAHTGSGEDERRLLSLADGTVPMKGSSPMRRRVIDGSGGIGTGTGAR